MAKDPKRTAASDSAPEVATDMPVLVYPGTENETRGLVVEDFGEMAGQPVDVGGNHIVDAARRWAVRLDDGGLVFVDSDDIVAQ